MRLVVGPGPLPARQEANQLVKALVDDRGTPGSRAERYGARVRDFLLVDAAAEADIAVLGKPWEVYGRGERAAVAGFAAETARRGLRLLVFAGGDLEPVVPFPSAVLFHPGLHRSRRRAQPAFASPYSFTDRVPVYAGDLVVRPRRETPVVGFCGQASARRGAAAVRRTRAALARARAVAGAATVVPNDLPTHVELRREVLRRLAADDSVETNFVIRDRYRAGMGREAVADPQHPHNVEFHRNLIESDYVVCVRGTGNFSARFFEAVSFGRIPVLVDTDSRLPFDFAMDWRELCVWVDRHDVAAVGRRIAEFHDALDARGFEDLQHRLRDLWLERLTENGFFAHLGDHFRSSSPAS
jgi:hypothetical protein